MSNNGWIGVDFDGTLAQYDKWVHADHAGAPIPLMVERVKRWLAEGQEVRIFTARIYPLWYIPAGAAPEHCELLPGVATSRERVRESAVAVRCIKRFCLEHIGVDLTITNVKDYGMIELWDDRAVQVVANTGEAVGTSTRGLV